MAAVYMCFSFVVRKTKNSIHRKKIQNLRKSKIFFCYPRVHKNCIDQFASILNLITPVFVDFRGIQPGAHWRGEIDNEIKNCSLFFVFWCEHADASSEVQREIELAVAHRRRIIPIALDSKPLPKSISHIQAVQTTNGVCAAEMCAKSYTEGSLAKNQPKHESEYWNYVNLKQIAPNIYGRIGREATNLFETQIGIGQEYYYREVIISVISEIDKKMGAVIILIIGVGLGLVSKRELARDVFMEKQSDADYDKDDDGPDY